MPPQSTNQMPPPLSQEEIDNIKSNLFKAIVADDKALVYTSHVNSWEEFPAEPTEAEADPSFKPNSSGAVGIPLVLLVALLHK